MTYPLKLQGRSLVKFINEFSKDNPGWSGQLFSLYNAEYLPVRSCYTLSPIIKRGYIADIKWKGTSDDHSIKFKCTDHPNTLIGGRHVWVNPENVRLILRKKHFKNAEDKG